VFCGGCGFFSAISEGCCGAYIGLWSKVRRLFCRKNEMVGKLFTSFRLIVAWLHGIHGITKCMIFTVVMQAVTV
jgi:hypothetical protein